MPLPEYWIDKVHVSPVGPSDVIVNSGLNRDCAGNHGTQRVGGVEVKAACSI